MSKKIFVIFFTFFLSFSYSAFAQDSLLEIKTLIQKLNYISYQNSTPKKTIALVKENVLQHVDFISMANEISNGWGNLLSKEQKQIFIKKLKERIVQDLSIQIMTKRFSHLSVKNIQKISFNQAKVTLATVNDFIDIDLLLVNKQNHWLVFDILINEKSLVKYYKDQMHALINRYGLKFFLK
jgi:ABC-type transporter MlaC component